MSELYIVGYGADGQPVYQDEEGRSAEEISRQEVMQALEKSEVWTEFNETFEPDDALLKAAVSQLLGKGPTLEQLQNLLRTIVRAGGVLTLNDNTGNRSKFSFTRRPVEEEPVVEESERPRGRDGRFLSDSQIAWGEMARWSETASSKEITERRRTDPAYAAFYRKNMEREMGGGVGDAVQNLNARPEEPKSKVTPELLSWVAEYNRSSAEQVRKQKRADFNPLGHEQYNKNFEAAIAAGLI